jgi:hypothetical protein
MPYTTPKKTLLIKVGGVGVEFSIPSSRLHASLEERYASFLLKKRPANVTCFCVRFKKVAHRNQEVSLTQCSLGAWHAHRRDFEANWQKESGELILEPSLYAFDAFLRVFLATFLLGNNGFLVHASAFTHHRKGFLFCGPSGTGKTTIAELAEKSSRIINDEICAVIRDSKGHWLLGSTPFWGAMGVRPATRRQYRLSAICFPVKNTLNKLRPASSTTAVGRFLRCVCLFGKDKDLAAAALELCAKCVATVPCFDFYFTRQCDVVGVTERVIWNHLKNR